MTERIKRMPLFVQYPMKLHSPGFNSVERLHFAALFFCFLMCSGPSLNAQFGIRSYYGVSDFPGWKDELVRNNLVLPDGLFTREWDLGIDYWLRLKNQRLEFYPEFAYSGFRSSALKFVNGETDLRMSQLKFLINSHIYLFDFLGDCNCPTFSKQGEFVKKGFFMMLSPGIAHYRMGFGEGVDMDNNLSALIALGFGLDIGLSDLITLTPVWRSTFVPKLRWDGLNEFPGSPTLDMGSRNWSHQIGLRIGFRPDYRK